MKDALIIGAAALAVFAVWRLSQPANPVPQVGAPPPANNFGTELEQLITGKTGVPVAAIGSAAQRAPTWVKIAVLPVGATAVAQSVITHPVDTAKKVGSAAAGVVHSVGSFLGF